MLKERASEFYHKEEERRGKKEEIKQKNRSGDSSIYCFASRKKINVRFIFFPRPENISEISAVRFIRIIVGKSSFFQQQNCAQCIFRIPRFITSASTRVSRVGKSRYCMFVVHTHENAPNPRYWCCLREKFAMRLASLLPLLIFFSLSLFFLFNNAVRHANKPTAC